MINWVWALEESEKGGGFDLGGRLTARTVGVENTRHAYVNTILVVETVCQSFGDAFPLIVACARTDGVDVAPATNKGSDIDQSKSKSKCAGKTAERLKLTSPRVVDVPQGHRIPLLDCTKRASVTG